MGKARFRSAMDELEDLGAPNCEQRLTPMEVSGERPVWECPECGLVRL